MESGFTLSIDWLAFTVLASNPQETMKVLGGDWSKAKGGFRGYPLSWMRTDGLRGVGKLGTNAPRRPNEIHVDLSGGLASALTLDQIRTLLTWVHAQQGHVTRIDCALDDRAGTVPVATIREAVSAGQCVTRAAQVRHIVSNLTHGTGATTGETMYFGSPQSQTLLRIYDKRLELQSKGQENLRELVVFALHSGMRLGEILSLTWAGVDLFRKTATVFESKNGERRTVPLNQTLMALLTEKAKVRHIRTALVFPSLAGTRLDPNHLRRALRPAMAKAGIVNCHFHDLRHTFATRLVQSGVDLYKVQRLLGHKSPMMTQRYAHHYPESLRDGVEILDRRSHRDTKMTTVLRVSESAVLEVVEKLVGDTGIEPVASSV